MNRKNYNPKEVFQMSKIRKEVVEYFRAYLQITFTESPWDGSWSNSRVSMRWGQ